MKNRYAKLMKKKNGYLKEFLRLTVLQKEALAENNMDRFNKLMDAKQVVIEQVDLLDVELTLLKTGGHNLGSDKTITHLAQEVNKKTKLEQGTKKYLQQIRVLDIEINELMKQNLSETIKSINKLHVARRTESAYRNNARVAHSHFVNKQR